MVKVMMPLLDAGSGPLMFSYPYGGCRFLVVSWWLMAGGWWKMILVPQSVFELAHT